MNNGHDLDTRIIDLTLGELLEAVEERVKGYIQQPQKQERNHVYGLKGLAKLLGCSKTTAARLKASGDYDEAITQIGALMVIDADMVMEIARSKSKRHQQTI